MRGLNFDECCRLKFVSCRLNKNISMTDFQFIYMMEYGHRLLGRVIGLAFIRELSLTSAEIVVAELLLLVPIPFFLYKRYLSVRTTRSLLLIASLIGAQGALGWYMVKSGLTHEGIAEANPSGVPRVSQYRLAAHLGLAFTVYAMCVRTALGIHRDWTIAGKGAGIGGAKTVEQSMAFLNTKAAGNLRMLVGGLTGLVLLTAVSGMSTAVAHFSKSLCCS